MKNILIYIKVIFENQHGKRAIWKPVGIILKLVAVEPLIYSAIRI
jgi:hypothetical protein